VQDRESSPSKDRRYTTVPRSQRSFPARRVKDKFPLRYHGSNQLRTSFELRTGSEPDSVGLMEFGREPASSC